MNPSRRTVLEAFVHQVKAFRRRRASEASPSIAERLLRPITRGA